ncbi:MAG TPA: aldehyde ferredoxin oxidoreductase N-terminal domain-containing protein [Candidatus Aminicenantes bacterium]|nr:aldehyde ferredoxin oxidoreductase N-terminal domain-containing protein [Candidatus Aminicenantes bacterium]
MAGVDGPGLVLRVDLTRRTVQAVDRSELFSARLGGAGAAIRLLAEECPPGASPGPVVLAAGPLNGLFPLASKSVAMFRSPLTGNLGESHCGGRTAVALRSAGLGALVIVGESSEPVYLAVRDGQALFRPASTLWGMASSATAARVMREREPGAGTRTILRIGPAGERGVAFASVIAETYRHFGRLGLGAVFGAKKLKGIVISGDAAIAVSPFADYRSLYDEIFRAAVGSPLMKKYHDLGTAENVEPLDRLGGLPTRNLRSARFEGAAAIGGEAMARGFLGRRLACAHCPVACIHIAARREAYPGEAYFYKTVMTGYDYELLYACGSMLGIADPAGVLQLLERVEALGLDAMSAGVALAWAIEASETGIVGPEQVLFPLAFGRVEPCLQALDALVAQPNDFYRELAGGVARAAARFGGAGFALAPGGLEMPGYHTGPGALLGFLIGARHSHLDGAGYAIDQKELLEGELPPEEVAARLYEEESWRQVLGSLAVCFFARGLYTPGRVSRCLALAGWKGGEEDLAPLGRAILREKTAFKLAQGFSWDRLAIPARFLETPAPGRGLSEDFLRRGIAAYARLVSS